MTRFRRTLIALAVCAVSLLGLGASLVAVPLSYRLQGEGTVIVVPAGEPIEIGDWTFTLTNSGEFPGKGVDENGLPTGNALIGAVIMIEPAPGVREDDEQYCDAALVQPGTEREWNTLVSEWEFGYVLLEGSRTQCAMRVESHQYEAVFLTPEGVYDDVAIDITLNNDLHHVFRFELVR
jgi:hypothetical protein